MPSDKTGAGGSVVIAILHPGAAPGQLGPDPLDMDLWSPAVDGRGPRRIVRRVAPRAREEGSYVRPQSRDRGTDPSP